jgi:hypothetical protein
MTSSLFRISEVAVVQRPRGTSELGSVSDSESEEWIDGHLRNFEKGIYVFYKWIESVSYV